MGSSVEIYLKYYGPVRGLVDQLVEALQSNGYHDAGSGHFVLPASAERWIGGEGWAQLTLGRTERGEFEETAFTPYGYELSLAFRGALAAFGRAIFDQLTGLGLPLAYGDYLHIFADYLPARGVRDFPPDTAMDERGREQWYERAT
jgi:hypothetical protein